MKYVWIFVLPAMLLCCCGQGRKTGPASLSEAEREVLLRRFVFTTDMLQEEEVLRRLDSVLNSVAADSGAFRMSCRYLEKPFGDPNSSYRNEKALIRILKRMIASPFYDSLEKLRPRDRLRLVMRNREGTPANDFGYVTADGREHTLYGLRSDYTLLYFYNPDCDACGELMRQIAGSETVTRFIREKRLDVLAVYVDEDTELWRRRIPEMPEGWIVARDGTGMLRGDSLYDVRAIPSAYLLDAEKTVLLKDCLSVPRIEEVLHGR